MAIGGPNSERGNDIEFGHMRSECDDEMSRSRLI